MIFLKTYSRVFLCILYNFIFILFLSHPIKCNFSLKHVKSCPESNLRESLRENPEIFPHRRDSFRSYQAMFHTIMIDPILFCVTAETIRRFFPVCLRHLPLQSLFQLPETFQYHCFHLQRPSPLIDLSDNIPVPFQSQCLSAVGRIISTARSHQAQFWHGAHHSAGKDGLFHGSQHDLVYFLFATSSKSSATSTSRFAKP